MLATFLMTEFWPESQGGVDGRFPKDIESHVVERLFLQHPSEGLRLKKRGDNLEWRAVKFGGFDRVAMVGHRRL